MGGLAETGVFSQWFHNTSGKLHYARWENGEVDIVSLGQDQKPDWAVEVKWSDHHVERREELQNTLDFCKYNDIYNVTITTKTIKTTKIIDGVEVSFVPTSVYCYTVGYNLVNSPNRK